MLQSALAEYSIELGYQILFHEMNIATTNIAISYFPNKYREILKI